MYLHNMIYTSVEGLQLLLCSAWQSPNRISLLTDLKTEHVCVFSLSCSLYVSLSVCVCCGQKRLCPAEGGTLVCFPPVSFFGWKCTRRVHACHCTPYCVQDGRAYVCLCVCACMRACLTLLTFTAVHSLHTFTHTYSHSTRASLHFTCHQRNGSGCNQLDNGSGCNQLDNRSGCNQLDNDVIANTALP